jgi:chromosome segregation ATPase
MEQAAGEARAAARKLESAARQVGALTARELSDRLARGRDLAQAIAKAERELAQALEREAASGQTGSKAETQLGANQRDLADEVAALADVLKQLKIKAALEQPELVESIGRAAQSNPPEEVEDSMRRNVAAIGAGRIAQAAREADNAAQRLDALALDLESARRAAVQPQLDRLLAAEKQAAELQEGLRSIRQASQQAETEKAISDLARLVENLAPGEGNLSQASEKLASATQTGGAGWTHNDKIEPGQSGFFVPPVGYTAGVAAVVLALRARIQEIMLDNALVERNGPVPPQYKSLVEDYYRILSQDLR